MELEIDHLCLETLARRQPVAGDLRLLTSAMKLVIELERIADLGVSIAARVVELASEPPLTANDDLLRMLTTAREMLTEAMGALETENVERATRAIAKDDVVDGYYTQIFNDVLSRMRENPDNIFARHADPGHLQVHRAHRRPRDQRRRAGDLHPDRRGDPASAARPSRRPVVVGSRSSAPRWRRPRPGDVIVRPAMARARAAWKGRASDKMPA